MGSRNEIVANEVRWNNRSRDYKNSWKGKDIMTNKEKCELLKDTIYQLYSKEGRSKSYISKLLNIDRKILIGKIKEWNFPESKSQRYAKPSTLKRIHKHKEKIISMLNKGLNISRELNISYKSFYDTFIRYDDDIKIAFENNRLMREQSHNELIEEQMARSKRNYYITDLEGEEWREIEGYAKYYVSNYGRVKRLASRYKKCYLLTPTLNKKNGYYYIGLVNNEGKSKNISLSRIVAFAFCNGHTEDKNTVNHIDGDKSNNKSSNLEWVSLQKNCIHCHQSLNKGNERQSFLRFSKIIYKDKYEFKTITAFAKFIGVSRTQARRYLDEPGKYNIKIIL